jgi:hypothetical protein
LPESAQSVDALHVLAVLVHTASSNDAARCSLLSQLPKSQSHCEHDIAGLPKNPGAHVSQLSPTHPAAQEVQSSTSDHPTLHFVQKLDVEYMLRHSVQFDSIL